MQKMHTHRNMHTRTHARTHTYTHTTHTHTHTVQTDRGERIMLLNYVTSHDLQLHQRFCLAWFTSHWNGVDHRLFKYSNSAWCDKRSPTPYLPHPLPLLQDEIWAHQKVQSSQQRVPKRKQDLPSLRAFTSSQLTGWAKENTTQPSWSLSFSPFSPGLARTDMQFRFAWKFQRRSLKE